MLMLFTIKFSVMQQFLRYTRVLPPFTLQQTLHTLRGAQSPRGLLLKTTTTWQGSKSKTTDAARQLHPWATFFFGGTRNYLRPLPELTSTAVQKPLEVRHRCARASGSLAGCGTRGCCSRRKDGPRRARYTHSKQQKKLKQKQTTTTKTRKKMTQIRKHRNTCCVASLAHRAKLISVTRAQTKALKSARKDWGLRKTRPASSAAH